MMEDPFLALSKDNTAPSESRAQWLTRRARMIFSGYRRDDYADPEAFLVQLTMLMEGYSDKVVMHISDPRTGIQSANKFPPALAEIKQALDDRTVLVERLRHYATLPPYRRLTYDAPRVHPANVKVPITAPQHAAMRELAGQLPDLARVDENGELWVPLQWMESARSELMAWKPFSREDLQGIYSSHDGGDGDTAVSGAAGDAGPPA
jgi:hypothetical protein